MKRTAFTVMVLLASTALATAADLPAAKGPLLAAPAAVSTDGFYIGLLGGSGGQSATSTTSPANYTAGVVAGYAATTGVFYYGASVEAVYQGVASASSPQNLQQRNGILLQEGAEFGFNIGSVMGMASQGAARAVHWPVYETVPASTLTNLVFAVRGGYAEKQAAFTDAFGDSISKTVSGPYAGLKVKAMISGQGEVFGVFDHMWWTGNNTFVPTNFGPVSLKTDNKYGAGYAYHF